ncbi:hypothetical protein K449DRAFT_461186 [Hypoxylon sp. EC38]|nr:hypothetical protein K449DRAFT_461186 [Hypoxylon sp. EC38]
MSKSRTTPLLFSGLSKATEDKIAGTNAPAQALYHAPEARDYPKNFLEAVNSVLFGDPDRKWGPFRKHVRAAKKQGHWKEWRISDIVEAEAVDSDDGSDVVPSESDGTKRVRSDRPYRMTDELKKNIRPARIDFEDLFERNHHPKDYDDDFYKTHLDNLYHLTVEFATKWFDGNISLAYIQGRTEEASGQIWASNLTPQFTQYARLVAHEDLDHQGWPTTLNNPVHRRWFIVGILAQIMETRIFNELLFGANKEIEEELQRQDLKFLDKEGYGRKTVRSIISGYDVQGRLLPHDFWPQVDDLAARTVKIFLPLLNVLKLVRGDTRADYSLASFTQEIHSILSYAGMIQVCMAVSPSIFHFLSATPGARMDWSLEHQADMRPYRESKAYWAEQDKYWKEYVTAAMQGKSTVNRSGQTIQIPKDQKEYNEMDYHRIRGAKIRYAVFPKVTRYRPHNAGKGIPDEPDQVRGSHWEEQRTDVEGQMVVDLSKCVVVYYQGLIYPEDGLIEAITLDQHMKTLPRKDPNGFFGLIRMIVVHSSSLLRKSFWHALVIGALPLMLCTGYLLGGGYFRQLFAHFFIILLWAGTFVYNIADVYSSRGKTLSPQIVIGFPFLIVYMSIVYYLYSADSVSFSLSDVIPAWIGRLLHI